MTKTRVFGIRLDARQAWAWQRLGQAAIRELIAPDGVCVHRAHRKAQINTRNGWFCYPCQDDLDQATLLPPDQSAFLAKQNRQLRAHIKRLQAQVNTNQNDSDTQMEHQPSLFD